MIDYLSEFSKKLVWLKPFFLLTTVIAFIIFGYVVLLEQGSGKDVLIIPSIIGMLWSLVCLFLLLVFPYVPSKADKQLHYVKRLKTRFIRAGYHIGAVIFVLLSVLVFWLSLKLLSVWYTDF